MNTALILVTALVAVGLPALAFDDFVDSILDGNGDLPGVSLDLGSDSNLGDLVNNGLNLNGISDKDFDDVLSGGLDKLAGSYDNRYDDDEFRFFPMPTLGGGVGAGSRHVSSIADLVNLVFGLGGHVVGRAGWIVRDALGALYQLGSLVRPTVDAGLRIASNLKRSHDNRRHPRDGMLFSQHRLGDDQYGLSDRSQGHLRTHPSQPSRMFDVMRQRYGRRN